MIFSVKFGKNASGICVMLSEAFEGEAMKKSSDFKWHKRFKKSHMSKSQMKTMLITSFDNKGIVHFEPIP
jgi:hypothetical protein